MQIYEAIHKDHEAVKKLLAQLVALDEHSEARHALIQKIKDDVIPHSRAEEAVFYNTLRAMDASRDAVMHGYKEHLEAEGLLRMLQVRDKTDISWKQTARKLKKALEHHIQEEEDEIFAAGRRVLSDEDATALGRAFEKLKPQIKGEGIVKTTLEAVIHLMPPRFTSAFSSKPH